ncbi:MAG TPA: gephyrin-like molybdotransferase Glp [Bacteroidota bacterium]|nr:gephyrin-like molybdotransferase Glp [Bacteroidota bacterium]
MKSAQEARKVILSSVKTLPSEQVSLWEAHGRVLGEDIIAREDLPAFDNSSMDGFALHAADTVEATETKPALLHLAGEVAAGALSVRELSARTAVRIMTGAPIPPGADAVLELEAVKTQNGFVQIEMPVSVGRNIRRKGEELSAGTVVFRHGTYLRAAHLGVLATLGYEKVQVYRKPSVAFLTTGNELVDVGHPLEVGQIRNSNAYALWGLIREAGAEPVNLGTARDDERSLHDKLHAGLSYDVLVTSGGVSVGAYDLVMRVLERLGVQKQFWKVNIKPGMPLFFGLYRNQRERDVPVFGLPGNPVSTMVTFLQFVRPAIQTMQGRTDSEPIRLPARMMQDYVKKDGKRHFLRGILRNDNGSLTVQTTGTQSSAALSSMALANCLIVVPEQRTDIKAGEEVEVELL